MAFEIDLDALGALRASERASDPLRVYPAATQDVSLVVAREIPAGPVMEAFAWGAGDLLEYAALIEDYRGAGVGADQKVLTMALRFRAEDRTLTAEDATVAKNAGVAAVTSAFGAALRE